jgi:DNA-binding YbaB/EbfC family protein
MANDSSPGSEQVDFALLAQRARLLQHRLEQTRDDLGQVEVKGLGGNGLVQATLSGENVLVALAIDPSVIDPDDPDTLSELVREAVNDAMARLAERRGEQLSSITDGLAGLLAGTGRESRIAPLTPARRRAE